MLHGREPEIGHALVAAQPIQAVAFTGSFEAGTALAATAARRAHPIPVFAEMGSLNPLLITPRAAAERGDEIAAGLATSIGGSVGQLCTKPGVIALVDDAAGQTLIEHLADALSEIGEAPMLYPGLRAGFAEAIATALADRRVSARLSARASTRPGAWQVPMLLEVALSRLGEGDPMLHELFGPAALVVWAADADELVAYARTRVEGTLTATIHADPDEPLARELLPSLARAAGRLIFNGYPTGVAVGHATMHGGPFPATTAPAHTSVGMTAIRRFFRPVGYQSFPDALLPAALKDANPLHLTRMVDGELTTAAICRDS